MRTRVTASALRTGVAALLTVGLLAASAAAADDGDSVDDDRPAEESTEQPEEQDVPEADGLDACWENIEPAPFVDTTDLSAESKAAVDCMYHYGITKGTSATTYSPAAPVIRLHMALFLVRASKVLGLPVPEGATESFDDLERVSSEGRSAVAQLKEMGITTGYSPQIFGPANIVGRAQMAHFLARMLRLTGITLPTEGGEAFEDVRPLSAAAQTDVSAMVELGIMDPVTADRFDPRGAVTREDMALYLARVLKIAEIKPVSLELELSSESLMVSGAATATVRAFKPDGNPYPGLLIDLFADYGWRFGTACNLDVDARLNGGDAGTSENCRIDIGDPRTDSNGEVTVGLAHNSESVVNWIFAWTGTLGQEFNEREVSNEVTRKIDWQPSPKRVTTISPAAVFYGQDISVVANLVGPNSAGQRMILVASHNDVVRVIRVGTTEDDGSVTFNVPGRDNPSSHGYRSTLIDETIFVYWDRNANSMHDGPAELSARTTIYWR